MNEKIENLVQTLQAVGPILKNAIKSGQIFNPQCKLTEPDPDILCEYDVKIPMSEGYSLTANIYRSKKAAAKGEKLPVVMSAHPYDNHLTPALKNTPFGGPPQQYRMLPQAGGKPTFSKLTSWESQDSNFWVAEGYAVVNMNLPGFANSEGPPSAFSEHQGKSYYEAIEWIAKQPWCNGKVGLNGVSFLAISQFHVAACQAYGGPPPSLCCISPWEGLTDPYRDIFCYGGVSEYSFPNWWWTTEVKPVINGTEKDFEEFEGCTPVDYLKLHPFYDEFWKAKAAKLEEITIPMLVCGSFSDHGLHTMGSFRAFEKAKSKHKWIYTHRTGKWVSYYSEEVLKLTKDFMDCFLKDDTSSGFIDTPPVRLEVRSNIDDIHEVRYEKEWPLARTEYTKLYLNGNKNELSLQNAEEHSEIVYSAKKGKVIFNYLFKEDTEISGYMKLRLWVGVRPEKSSDPYPDDMIIFMAASKLDMNKNTVYFNGGIGSKKDLITRGFCRVSRRELDHDESTEWHPVQNGNSNKLLKPEEIVPVDIEIYPSSTFFKAGETLQLIISANEIIPSFPFEKSSDGYDKGKHVIHFGEEFESYLLVPKIPQ